MDKETEKVLATLSSRRTHFSVTEEIAMVNIFVHEMVMVKYSVKEDTLTVTAIGAYEEAKEAKELTELLLSNKDTVIYSSKLFWKSYCYTKLMYY